MRDQDTDLKDLLMPSTGASSADNNFELTEKAIETAEAQAVFRDVLSVTLGNIFAFFALLFPPLIASSLDLTARMRESKNGRLDK